MDNWVAIALLIAGLLILGLCWELWRTYVKVEALEKEMSDLNEENNLLLNRNRVAEAENHDLRKEIKNYKTVQPEEIIDVTPNPQHFRPMFDSQGALFNVPNNDVMFFPEGYEEVEVGYEAGTPATGEGSGPESVQDGEETTNGILRSGTVSGV